MIVESPVTGSVWKVECSVGDQVQPGSGLLVLESMKMEFPVEAEAPGVVKAIFCSAGDSVDEGAPLVELE